MNWTLEVVVVPVSDIDRAKAFYADRDDTPADGRTVVPLCPFLAGWISRHDEYADVVDQAALDYLDQ